MEPNCQDLLNEEAISMRLFSTPWVYTKHGHYDKVVFINKTAII